ncbi:hypothetical protein Q1695_005535 [Nippostrongylus brasiliensis]|nr:hypothetical protein Q1695_005535 [Nippostrongylus brasiliensis]
MNLRRNLIWVSLGLLLYTHSVLSLSTRARNSLQKVLGNVDLEKRRERLHNIARKTLHNYNISAIASDSSNATDVPIESALDVLTPSDASISDINKEEGIDEYLFEGDINLSEEQLSGLEAVAEAKSRRKRSAYRDALKWTNNELFYYFDASIDAGMKTTIKTALNYIQARTCLKFTESSTATQRVRVFSGSGCYSAVGMWEAGQDLSLAPGCKLVGIAAHEFMHALGIKHTQSRSNRDSYLKLDLSNVDESLVHNYIKMEPSEEIVYTPYEYGSVMHYDAKSFANSGNSMIATDGRYMRTMGSNMVTFYDLQEINKHYNCTSICKTGATCLNGGVRNPKNCATCICPAGYGAANCKYRHAGCGYGFNAKTTWTTRKLSVPTGKGATRLDNPVKCNDMIWAPAGKKIQIRVTALNAVTCMNGCIFHGVEPMVLPNKLMTSPRICCPGQLNQVLTSAINPTPIVGHSLLSAPTFTYQYRYV